MSFRRTSPITGDVDRAPGTWVSQRAARKSALAWFYGVQLVAVGLLSIGLVATNRAKVLTGLLVIALAVFLRTRANRAMDNAMPWRWGAKAEIEVGRALDLLKQEGYDVLHDIHRSGQANLDHVVSGPNGVYLVETKSHRFGDRAPRRAKAQAAALRDEVGVWVTPVICVLRRKKPPFQADGVWVVGADGIVDWIRTRSNRPADRERFERWSNGLARRP